MVVVPRDDYDCMSYHEVYQVSSTLDDSRHSTLTKNRTERDRVVGKLKQLKNGNEYQKTKPNFLEVYMTNVDQGTNGHKGSTKVKKGKKVDIKPDCSKLTEYLYYNIYRVIIGKKADIKPDCGKKVDIKPDCGKLTDGITEDLDDDTVSKMYDDLLLQLGFGDGQSPLKTTDSSKEIADYKNPFKFGYLLKVKPSRSKRCKAGFRRALKAIRNVLTRPFLVCRNSKIQPNSEK
ncbi:hypothetical protein LOTGIDRAFT_155266 [Lottia gigantea]|uniref:Uncharacterized protein n=1 Tax=Lottia gigantea TaxID=225164 RepID=V3Z0G6_LOTGI|nr:hypothetical protein LOTGIDRAFT_155266 [Lottia gigantea]ESO83958.1 hypothetical protein LOTGIDRAFT_155266 [Lottia gigantea]